MQKRTEFSWSDYDEFLFASEIAWIEMKEHGSLDDILCDPDLAQAFDQKARRLAPGFTSLQYRWGALTLRKTSETARVRSENFATLSLKQFKLGRQLRSWMDDEDSLKSPGLYLIPGLAAENRVRGERAELAQATVHAIRRRGPSLTTGNKRRDAKFVRFLPQT